MDNSSYFSVKCRCNINVHQLSDPNLLPSEADFEAEIPTPFRLSTELAHLDAASLRCLRHLGESSEELVSYLKMQAKKIDVLLGYVLSLQDDAQERFEANSLSASGLSYLSDTAVCCGQLLRIKLFLSEEPLAVYCYAEIVSCQPLSEPSSPRYQVDVRFNRLRETDQEHLIRATLHLQTQQLKQRQR